MREDLLELLALPILQRELLRHIPKTSYYRYLRKGLVQQVPSPFGMMVLPGPRLKGRRPSPRMALAGYLLRRVAEAWGVPPSQVRQRAGRGYFPDGTLVLLYPEAVTADAVEKAILRERKRGWEGKVVVYHPYPKRLRWLSKRLGVEVHPLEPLIPRVRGERAPQGGP